MRIIYADYLVSGDSDLLELKEYHQTKIVGFETIHELLL
jgi:predicted nucleic acid-binding protein